jgi:hypothetical protein
MTAALIPASQAMMVTPGMMLVGAFFVHGRASIYPLVGESSPPEKVGVLPGRPQVWPGSSENRGLPCGFQGTGALVTPSRSRSWPSKAAYGSSRMPEE